MDKLPKRTNVELIPQMHALSESFVGTLGRFKAAIADTMQKMWGTAVQIQPNQDNNTTKALSERETMTIMSPAQTALDLAQSLETMKGDDLINATHLLKQSLFEPNMPILEIAKKLATHLRVENLNSESKNAVTGLLQTIVKNELGGFKRTNLDSVYDLLVNNGAEDLGKYSAMKNIAMGRWKNWK